MHVMVSGNFYLFFDRRNSYSFKKQTVNKINTLHMATIHNMNMRDEIEDGTKYLDSHFLAVLRVF